MSLLVLLSPAKKLDMSSLDDQDYTEPSLLSLTKKLVAQMKECSVADLKRLMKISDNLAQTNVERYQEMTFPLKPNNAKQALFAFQGDVYAKMRPQDFTQEQLAYANKTLRILSGLYGLLKPLDLIHPYRLEMGTALPNERGKNLYEFWQNDVTDLLNKEIKQAGIQHLVNLASNEYCKVVKQSDLLVPMVTIAFKEKHQDSYKIIGVQAKRARGLMARFITENKINRLEDLQKFDAEDYTFHPDMSDNKEFVFTRG